MGPKKGVITQSVKDVVQSLVDDDLVFKDKIGTSVSKFLTLSKNVIDILHLSNSEDQEGIVFRVRFYHFRDIALPTFLKKSRYTFGVCRVVQEIR